MTGKIAAVGKGRMLARQKVFVEEYLKCWNATEAARRAGYSTKNASYQGFVLLKRADVKAVIRERLAERVMGTDEVLARLSEQARGGLAEFLTVEEGEGGKVEVAFDWKRLVQEGKGHLLRAVTVKGVRLEFYDAQAALGLLARHLGSLGGGKEEAQEGKLTLQDWDEMIQERLLAASKMMLMYGERDEVGDGEVSQDWEGG